MRDVLHYEEERITSVTPPKTRECDHVGQHGEIMFKRGYRDGLAGLNMSSTPTEYMEGWMQGRRERIEERLRCPWLAEYESSQGVSGSIPDS